MLPIEVKRDYLAHFEARVFRDTVCYVYENLEHTIILDTLGNGPARIILTDGPLGYGFCNLHLVVRDGDLYLFYQAFSGREKGYGLYVCMPYQENCRGVVFEKESPVGAVSYTHLDVYKRQMQVSSNVSPCWRCPLISSVR